jgi:hypothetical protein
MARLHTKKVDKLLTHDLMRLKRELQSPRLSALRSTLGLAVPRAALHALESGMTGQAPPHMEVLKTESDCPSTAPRRG